MSQLLERDCFVAWLRSKTPDAVVGVASLPFACPIATYLCDSGANSASVGFSRTLVGCDFSDTPSWAQRFIGLVDVVPLRRVLAGDALRLLGEDTVEALVLSEAAALLAERDEVPA